MKKTYCDRCGREVSPYGVSYGTEPSYSGSITAYYMGAEPTSYTAELCLSCRRELDQFIRTFMKDMKVKDVKDND